MKKYGLFCLFLLLALALTVSPKHTALAELQGYTVSVSAQISADKNGEYSNAEGFKAINNTLSADYSLFQTDGSIMFTGEALAVKESDSSLLVYEWKMFSGTILTNSANLVLYKKATSINQPLILIGETKYILTITNTADNSYTQIRVTTNITDTLSNCNIQTFAPTIPAEVTSISDNLGFSAKLPIVNGSTINWYLKVPNATGFNLVKESSENFVFTPNTTINNHNGFGAYKLMAIGYNKNTKKHYYSSTFEIYGAEIAKTIVQTDYEINSKIIDNSQANIEAFYYTLSNSENLISENIYWYINNTRVHSGKEFTYEPLTTDAYKIVAKYKKADGTLIELSNLKQEPATTGTYILLIYIGAAVVILSIILAISIITTNKKRDVVW